MENIEFIRSIGIMIVAAAAIVLVARRLNVPNIVLYIVAGLLLGPVLGILHPPIEVALDAIDEGAIDHAETGYDALHLIAEFGIVLLLFLVGLELSLDKIRDIGRIAIVAGLGQIVLTAVLGFALALTVGFTPMQSLFIATALTFSSTVVVVKLLDQKGELNSLHGRIAVGIFLVQDVVVIAALTILAGLGSPEDMTVADVALGLLRALIGTVILLSAAILASRYLLAGPIAWASRSAETMLIWSLFWCFLFVAGAQELGLSPEIGAFLAGMSLAQLPVSRDLLRRLRPLVNFFIAIFFISLGAKMELGDVADYWLPCVVFSAFVLLGKLVIFMLIISRAGYGERTSFFTSVTVAQISEFSLILTGVAAASGLIDESVVLVVTVVALATFAASAYMILYNAQLYAIVRRLGLLRMFRAKQIEDDVRPPELSGHVVVVGMNALGRAISKRLHERGEQVLAIDSDPRKLDDLPCRTMIGNVEYLDVIDEASLARAKFAVSALQIEDTNNLFAWRCREMNVPVAVHAFDRSVMSDLQHLEVDYQIDTKGQGSVLLVTEMTQRGVVGA